MDGVGLQVIKQLFVYKNRVISIIKAVCWLINSLCQSRHI